MSTTRVDRLVGAAALACAATLLAGCGSGGGSVPSNQPTSTVKVVLSDAGCSPSPASAPAGPVKFEITNSSSAKVTEVELQSNGKILGEKESVTPGLSGDFSLRLDGGTYSIYCPGGAKDTFTFTVTGGSAPTRQADTSLADATKGYHNYVVNEVNLLVPATKVFTDAVRAGDMAKAKASFAPARVHYESVEPVAESFGDLDPDIDARIDDVPNPAQWTGFHRIEKALWQDNTLAGMAPLADKLDADVKTLQARVSTATYQPAQLANGAGDLLTEVSTSKVTGEEDRYSHTDLWDFQANIDGARQCFELLKPALAAKNPDQAQQLEARFTDVVNGLNQYRQGDGFVDYSTVSQEQRRKLADSVNALAEPLSKVAGQVV
jgi:iron uptake system component EfeO